MHRWRRREHINELELATIVLALRCFIRRGGQGQRVVILSDSLVAIGAVAKGRSSQSGILRYTRIIAALLLGYDVELCLVHVPTEWCPADPPSRGLPLPSRRD